MPSDDSQQNKSKVERDTSGWLVPLIFAVTFLAYILGAAVLLLDRPN